MRSVWLCPWGVCGCGSLPLQSGGRAGTEKSPATGTTAATTVKIDTTLTVSTCYHSYSPTHAGMPFTPFPPLAVKTVVIDLVLCSWPHGHI